MPPEAVEGNAPENHGADITSLLQAWSENKTGAGQALFDRVYPDLRRLSARRLSLAIAKPLDATELVHEAFLRLVEQRDVTWRSRDQFFAVSARLIRRILVDEGRKRRRAKRGGGTFHLDVESLQIKAPESGIDILVLDDALTQLAKIRSLAAEVVELRFFGGLNIDETAERLGLGRATVIRSWRFARAWLGRKLAAAK